MATDNQVKYEIAVTRTGEGATQAVNDFKAVEAAVAKANGTVVQNTAAVTQNAQANSVANKQFNVFKGTLTLVAGQAFPQLTASVMVAKNAIDAMRASGTQAQLGLGTLAGGIAGMAALVTTAAMAWASYAAEKEQATAERNLSEQEVNIAARLRDQVKQLELEKEITREQSRRLQNSTGDSSGNRQVQEFLRFRNYEIERQMISDLHRQWQLYDSIAEASGTILSTEQKRATIAQRYGEELQVINWMLDEGLVTLREADALADQAAIRNNARLAELRNELTETQRVTELFTEQLSEGLSREIVNSFRQGKFEVENFRNAVSEAFASIAQDILKQQIIKPALNAVFSFFGGFAAEGGAFPRLAALGGGFPRYQPPRWAANGLTGVSEVSGATYFPRFNVIAGEAGREMMTVLARPRMMEVGGMQAVVGSAQGNELAITSASDLAARNGKGGVVDIRVTLGPELRAEIVQQSVEGARVQVAYDMRGDTPISRGVKGLTA